MYKPPENTNRVKSIRSKFENIERDDPKTCNFRANLVKQISDPVKRNIKRTPAFREKSNGFQRNVPNNRSCHFETKQLSALNNCDNKEPSKPSAINNRPVLVKSKSSHDFAYIRSKFDQNQRNNDLNTIDRKDVSLLYTEPIPKCLRNKSCETDQHVYSNVDFDIHKSETLKLSRFIEEKVEEPVGLTDTLKQALKKPLPNGPAPKKPPRTFIHSNKEAKSLERNSSFLHKETVEKETTPKKDARYMLHRLENALRNNKIKKRVVKEPSTTSGEDSDDSLLFRGKSKRQLPSPPSKSLSTSPSANFNCLNGLTLCNPTYAKIGEPNSSFFVSCDKEEPVYAEPINLRQKGGEEGSGENIRNSLYYLSTPLLVDGNRNVMEDKPVLETPCFDSKTQKQISAESSSLSSFTSDLDSAASTPLEEQNTFESTIKIKQLINAFETKSEIDSNRRVEDLKLCLQKTLERSFSEDHAREVSHVDTMVNKFQNYVKTMPKYQKPKLGVNDRLFYCCLIVGYDLDRPVVRFKFPNVKIPDRIEDLCFPEAFPLDQSNKAQCYSLVITTDKGDRIFGYCRRVIPEGCTKCIPLAYCLLSTHRAPRFYKKILRELESRHGIPDKLRDELISDFYYNRFPRPGESIKINLKGLETKNNQRKLVDSLDLTSYVHIGKTGEYGTLNKIKRSSRSFDNMYISDDKICNGTPNVIMENGGKTELILTLHHDTRYEEADLRPLHQLPDDILLKIFASLLLERKVIFISCVISKLSCCVDALQSILYPFSWPHTFIPILPQCLWDVVESPTPVICGILSVAVVNEHKIEHGIVVDLDEGNILSHEGDENSILSDSMKKAWRQGISLANTIPPDDYVHSVYLIDAYIKVFIVSMKHYKSHINNGTFDNEAFIRNGKTRGIRRFLKWFTESTMFMSFIESVIGNPDGFNLFDNKIVSYGSEESNVIMTKLMEWKK